MKKRERYTYIAFAISFIVTIVISILYLEEFSALQKSNEQLERSHEIKNEVLKVQANLIEAENSQRGFLITEDKELLGPLYQAEKNIYAGIAKLKDLTQDVPEQQQLVTKLKETVSQRFRVLYETANAATNPNLLLFLKNAEKGKAIMHDFRYLSGRIDAYGSAMLAERKDQNAWLAVVTSFYLKLILIVSILFQLVSFFVITKAFKRRRQNERILEDKIKELNVSNSEMEEIAFVASHDLQEPLRKIRTFGDKLIKQYAPTLNKDGQKLLDKMSVQSKRMQELLTDFINYTRLIKSTEVEGVVFLNQVIEDVRADFNELILAKNATLKSDPLPAVQGFNRQLHLLFSNLLDNALKFSKAGVLPVISIAVSKVGVVEKQSDRKYVCVSFSDNGIGFEKEFAEKIFIIFQRLHSQNSTYLGKGIGLAICKRVMINHDGFITASGEAGVGATFNLYFPEEKIKS